MTSDSDSSSSIYSIGYNDINAPPSNCPFNVIRPVVELYKTATITKLESY